MDRINLKSKKLNKKFKETYYKNEEEHKKKDPSKVRCKFWPSCKDEKCEYAHPKE